MFCGTEIHSRKPFSQYIAPIKKLRIPHQDSYFAAYRNFLNVCTFHKNGQESLTVYQSGTLTKRMFFPPAKQTKFEEWMAIQLTTDQIKIYDFRPDCLAFEDWMTKRDGLLVRVVRDPVREQVRGMEGAPEEGKEAKKRGGGRGAGGENGERVVEGEKQSEGEGADWGGNGLAVGGAGRELGTSLVPGKRLESRLELQPGGNVSGDN